MRIVWPALLLCVVTSHGAARADQIAKSELVPMYEDALTGDWGGRRTWLAAHGFTVTPRLTQFMQGLNAGNGEHRYVYGGKADVEVRADLASLGFWNGLSLTVKAEQNFGQSVNGWGGTMVPPNTALAFPGIEGTDAFDVSSFYFAQSFGSSASLVVGKVNMIDGAASKPFAGGAGITSFWNTTFAAPPSGLVPPYLLGALLAVSTPKAKYNLWVYDPVDCVNQSCLEAPFAQGVTVRGNIDVPVTLGGLSGPSGICCSLQHL